MGDASVNVTGGAGFIVLGFVLGMRHATDPDHVIAVSTIVARRDSSTLTTTIGAAWGVGHTLTIMLVGGSIILFGLVIPPRVGLSMELAVSAMLIALGLLNLTDVLRRIGLVRARDHREHSHLRGNALLTSPLARPLMVGVVHGLAGSAAVALLVLTTIRDTRWALWYLFVFGLGTVAGMMLMTAAIALPMTRPGVRPSAPGGAFRVASGVISLAFGLFVAYRIGVVDGLFTSTPHWTPR